MDNIKSGIDIVNINRIRKIIQNRRDGFYNKIFTDKEIEYITLKGHNVNTVAGFFASKEAVSKVLGTGIGAVNWKDIEILHDSNGKPFVNIMNRGKERLYQLGLDKIEISISHERDYAVAFGIGYGFKYRRIKEDLSMESLIPQRKADSHKGSYGRIGIIGGSQGMTGAPYLASMAALMAGSGLVYSIIPKSLETIMSIKLTEVIVRAVDDGGKAYFNKKSLDDIMNITHEMDTIAIGPGFGVDEERELIVDEVIKNYNKPLVIDADGINCISNNRNVLNSRNQPVIITPHTGEMSRFVGVGIKEIQENRIYYSKYISDKYNIIVVLKGTDTIVSSPKGDIYINKTGNPGMATAGSGDVLTGIIASFIGQGLSPFDAARLGTYIHGLAGDLACNKKGENGMIATDILDNIPYSLKRY